MFSSAAGRKDGKEIWSVTHSANEDLLDLAFVAIRLPALPRFVTN